ncbi:hemolysin-III related-domain-containing protein [Mycena epipterygia]|nr:hemolysin-III related-domain-containing protein [Mycena epipterygia]
MLDAAERPPLRRRRMSAPLPRRAPPRLPPCRPLPLSLEALDLSPASPAQALASLRFLVLSYLADLERRLSLFESRDALECISTARDMLQAIRADVCSHLPDLGAHLPDMDFHLPDIDLKAHLPDIDFKSHLPDMDFKSHLPDMDFTSHLPDMDFLPDIDLKAHLPDLDLKSLVARWHDLDFSRPLSYVPTLSARLRGLHAHLADGGFSFSAPSFTPPSFDFPTPPALATFLADVDAFLAELPRLPAAFSLPCAVSVSARDLPDDADEADTVARALALSANGTRLIAYADLPEAWRNNAFVVTGYRFIPLRRPHTLLASIFRPHNETLNIHTHLVPLVFWGATFAGIAVPSGWREWVSWVPWLAPLTSAPTAPSPLPLDLPEALFTLFALACLASSTLWHTMAGCAHRGAMETCARVDYVGIGWLIATSIATIVHYGYACAADAADATPLGHAVLHPVDRASSWLSASAVPSWLAAVPFLGWEGATVEETPSLGWKGSLFDWKGSLFNWTLDWTRAAESWTAYHPVGAACLALCLACGIAGNVLPFCAWFNRVENRLWRLGFFVGISFSALAPLAGIAALAGWGAMMRFVAPIGPSLLFYILGLVIYALQIPECFLGGRGAGRLQRVVDACGGGSHALWHVCIVLAMRAHRDGIREIRRAAAGGCVAAGVGA